jgi:hypothetical protein
VGWIPEKTFIARFSPFEAGDVVAPERRRERGEGLRA